MESEVSLYHTFMEEELGRLDCIFPIFVGNQEHNLYNQPFENLNGKIRKYTKSKLLFSSDDVVKRRCTYLRWRLRRNGRSQFITGA